LSFLAGLSLRPICLRRHSAPGPADRVLQPRAGEVLPARRLSLYLALSSPRCGHPAALLSC